MPLVSIIIPHFNRADLLAAALDSVRAQSETSWEAILVDDGSEQQHWERTRAMAAPQVRIRQRRDGTKGPSRCRNLGVKAAAGDHVLFLDSDDLLAPWCLEQRLRVAAAHPEADLWVFPVLLFTERAGDSDVQWNALQSPRPDLDRFLQSDPPWHTSSALWRRDMLVSLGGFNEAVCYGDDSDLHIRALVKGARIQKFPEAIPDAFVRRGTAARITNTLSTTLIESRRVRLEQGTRFLLDSKARREHLRLWEGQYFVEAEFLLFNLAESKSAIGRILADWRHYFHPSRTKRSLVCGYFNLALGCRRNAYLLLRLARRLAMKLLPAEYFPRGGSFQTARAASEVMQTVRSRLKPPPAAAVTAQAGLESQSH